MAAAAAAAEARPRGGCGLGCFEMPPACCRPTRRRERAGCASWLPWALGCSLLLAPAWGYVIVNSVSWSVANEVDEELDISSNEEVLPALLEDTGSIWKQSYPASVYKEEEEEEENEEAVVGDPGAKPGGTGRAKPQISSPSRMFSYRRESAKASDSLAPQERSGRTARSLAHRHHWGFLATTSAQEKVAMQRHGKPPPPPPRACAKGEASGSCALSSSRQGSPPSLPVGSRSSPRTGQCRVMARDSGLRTLVGT